MFSTAIFETYFSYHENIGIAAMDYIYLFLTCCALSIDRYTLINKFYSFINFTLLINAVDLLLNCLVLILCLYIHFLTLKCYSLAALFNLYCKLYISW